MYVAGQEGYEDNSGSRLRPREGQAGTRRPWLALNGQFREKDGRQLVIRDVIYDALDEANRPDRAEQPCQIGVKLDLVEAPAEVLHRLRHVGDFDIGQFGWAGDPFSLCCLNQIYTTGAESNFGKISTPEIDAKSMR